MTTSNPFENFFSNNTYDEMNRLSKNKEFLAFLNTVTYKAYTLNMPLYHMEYKKHFVVTTYIIMN